MQFLEDITHPPVAGVAESPAGAAVRRGAHWVALPDEHDLLGPLARLVCVCDGHRVVPYHVVVGLIARVVRIPSVADDALAAVATFALGGLELDFMESVLGYLKAKPYSLSFDGFDAVSLLRSMKQIAAHDRLAVDPRFMVEIAHVLQFEAPILVLPAAAGAAAAAGAVNVPLTDDQRLGLEFLSSSWPCSEQGLLGPFADLALALGQIVLSAHKIDAAGQAQRPHR